MANDGYTPIGTFSDTVLSDADRAKVAAYKQQWETAFHNNNRMDMDAAHARAEAIRAKYGYSGGDDGSEHNIISTSQSMSRPVYTAASLAQPQSAESYIDSLYSAYEESALAALKSAYDQNVLTLGAQKDQISPYYQDARNAAATQSEIARGAFNELAAARGLNSGAGGQASLAMGNVLLGNLSGLSRAEANALSAIDLERARLETAYQNDIAQAIADGNLEKAQALYSEFVRVDNAMMSMSQAQANENYRAYDAQKDAYDTEYNNMLARAKLLASLGDFSGIAALG